MSEPRPPIVTRDEAIELAAAAVLVGWFAARKRSRVRVAGSKLGQSAARVATRSLVRQRAALVRRAVRAP